MRHQGHSKDFSFVQEPVEFDKTTDRELLQYCVGAVLYMPATKDFRNALLTQRFPGLTSMVMCFEDSIDEKDIRPAEENVVGFLRFAKERIDAGELSESDIPLIFLRVRSIEQYDELLEVLDRDALSVLAGFVFPKFSRKNAIEYLSRLDRVANESGCTLYGMPILEGREIAYKESRMQELLEVKAILDAYKSLVLNVRVGGTDFSSCFGMRRGIDYTIYDIMPVRDCLLDIINVFARENSYVISGPVWEYFAVNKSMKFDDMGAITEKSLLSRETIVNDAVDGLLREIILDRANGFVGKTIIHPSHLNYVNAMLAVVEEEYKDALQIVGTSGGVVKGVGERANKMNEIRPHTNWAHKILSRAQAYGVIKDESEYKLLFS